MPHMSPPMRNALIGLFLCLSFAGPAGAWNEKGHMVVARLAWLRLTEGQRESATAILRAHPHYDEFLSADRPTGISADEWVFMRAAYWPDWIRSNHTAEYSKPTWHYISAGFVPSYSKLSPTALPAQLPNVVTQISESIEKTRSGSAKEKAVYLCWLMHLVGDIHQPLHCCSLLSETFPTGDLGGNLSLVRIDGGQPVKLHPMWDGLLGKATTLSSIQGAVLEVQKVDQDNAAAIEDEITSHVLPAEWANDGFELAKTNAYLNGDLRPANVDNKPHDDEVPNVTEAYAQNAGKVARLVVAKAGRRLAATIAEALR
jgi:hypothetical protein